MRLISFSVTNYLSFLSEQTIHFGKDSRNVDAILGSNGSGKSNLFKAMGFFREFVRTSTKFEGQNISYDPFVLNSESEKQPTIFKAEMQTAKHIYKYEFSLLLGRVTSESLSFKKPTKNASYETIFSRNSLSKNRYEQHGFGNSLLKNTRDDALVLTKAWENNNNHALEVFKWLNHLKLISGGWPMAQTAQKVTEDATFKEKLLDLLRRADLYIQDVTATKINMPDELYNSLPFKDELKKSVDRTGYNVTTTHLLRDANGKIVGTKQLPMNYESRGTQRIFELAYPLIDSLEEGNILYIDEFEMLLHPRECQFLISLFADADNKDAQLIINTHNTQIMDQIGRNSIHLFGKNSREETIIGEIPKDIRSDDSALERKYNKGMFGAVPNIVA
jgi:AAA15 family ATPase/GTPase